MISRLRVQGFKALKDVDVSLGRFTVLIGPNDTGKTSFLEALYALSESTRGSFVHCFWSSWESIELVHKPSETNEVELEAELSALHDSKSTVSYKIRLRFFANHNCEVFGETIKLSDKPQPFDIKQPGSTTSVFRYRYGNPGDQNQFVAMVAGLLHPTVLGRWDVEELGRPSHLPPERPYPFDPSGYGLSTRLAELKLSSEKAFSEIRDQFCSLFPEFKDIRFVRTTSPGLQRDAHFRKTQTGPGDSYEMIFVRKDGAEVRSGLASGGTLIMLAFLTMAELSGSSVLLLCEEPENGLHPGRLKEVVNVLRLAASSGIDRQVVLTTHSPLLLDYVEPEEVRVFLRNDGGDVEVHDLSKLPDIRDRLKYMMLGELVYNEGETELVKEIREHAPARPGGG